MQIKQLFLFIRNAQNDYDSARERVNSFIECKVIGSNEHAAHALDNLYDAEALLGATSNTRQALDNFDANNLSAVDIDALTHEVNETIVRIEGRIDYLLSGRATSPALLRNRELFGLSRYRAFLLSLND